MNRNISKEYTPVIDFDRVIQEKRRYTPRNTSINPITKGKKLGPKYTKDECMVIAHMCSYPGGIKGDKESDKQIIAEIFNRSKASINMTIGNANTILFNTGKLVNASNNLKKVCHEVKDYSRKDFDTAVYNILKDYNYNNR